MSPVTGTVLPGTRVLVIPVAIEEYDAPPAGDALRRIQLDALPRVKNDVGLLRDLFESDEYRAAGFQMLESITGSAWDILARLTAIRGMLAEQARPLYALVFWSGHGRAWPRELRLATQDCLGPMEPGDGLAPAEVINKFSARNVTALGFLCDVCQGGSAGASVIETAAQQIELAPNFRGISALFSAYPYENAKDGLFVETLERLLRVGPSPGALKILANEGRGGFNPFDKLLALQDLNKPLAAEMQVLRKSNASVPSPLPASIGDPPALFPNPAWRRDAMPVNVGEARRRRLLQVDVDAHFLPKARGLEPEEPGWFFSGRHAVARKMVAWAHGVGEAGGSNLFVLTGGGGTGKSAIVGRFVTLSDPGYRAAAREQGWPETVDVAAQTVPPIGAIDAALHLRKLTALQVTQALTELLQLDPREVGGLQLSSFVKNAPAGAESGRSVCVVLDALDESEEPATIATELIRPLAAKGWRILTASRRSAAARQADDLLGLLGPAHVHSLDDEPTAASEIAEYVERRLASTRDSPYAGAPELVRTIGTAIGERAAGKFLYARLCVSGLLRRPQRIELANLERYLGRDVDDILVREFRDLDSVFMATFDRTDPGATTLFAALAWAAGDGLPLRDGLWQSVASALAAEHTHLTQDHTRWLLREGGRFIVESGDGDQAVYRLYHESLNEYFRRRPRAENADERIADALELAVEQAGGWELANPYLLRHLATHLAPLPGGESLRRLLLDYTWIETKLRRLGIQALLDDYGKCSSPDAAVATLERALSQSAHVLAWDPNELPSQLIGRLLGLRVPKIEAVVERASRVNRHPWLRPVVASLAGERSLRWLRPVSGQTLSCVTVSEDGRWAAHCEGPDVFLWDLSEWRSRGMLFGRARGSFYALALSNDARSCLGGDSVGGLWRWSAANDSILEWRAHDDHLITPVASNADGTRALSADYDGRLVAWDFSASTYEAICDDNGHRTTAMSFDAAGSSAVVAQSDGSIYLLQLSPPSLHLLFTLAEHPIAVARTSDNSTVFAAGVGGEIQACSVANGARPIEVLRMEEEPTSLALSADNGHLILGTKRGTVAVWSLDEARYVARYPRAHTYEVKCVSFCRARRTVMSADILHLKEWALEAGEQDRKSVRSTGQGVVVLDDLLAAAVTADGQLGVWNVRTGSILSQLSPPSATRPLRPGWGAQRRIMLASRAARVLASDDQLLCIWDLRTSAAIASLSVQDLRAAAVSADGTTAIFADSADVMFWQPGSAPVLLGSHGEEVRSIAISPDGKLALSSAGDRTVMLWRLDARSRRAQASPKRFRPEARDKPTTVTFANNVQAVVATGDGSLFVLDTRKPTADLLRLHARHGADPHQVLVTSDGRAVTASYDETIKVWNLHTHDCVAEIPVGVGNLGGLSASGDRVLLSTRDGVLKILSLVDGALVAAFQADKQLSACAADADLQWIAATDQDGEMHFLHLEP